MCDRCAWHWKTVICWHFFLAFFVVAVLVIVTSLLVAKRELIAKQRAKQGYCWSFTVGGAPIFVTYSSVMICVGNCLFVFNYAFAETIWNCWYDAFRRHIFYEWFCTRCRKGGGLGNKWCRGIAWSKASWGKEITSLWFVEMSFLRLVVFYSATPCGTMEGGELVRTVLAVKYKHRNVVFFL